MTELCDPFSAPVSTSACLLNIAMERAAAAPKTQEYLTETFTEGRKLQEKFQEECAEDEVRFMKPIRRRKVTNFACENIRKKRPIASKDKPATESLKDVFIRMLVLISQKTNFDLKHVIASPITEFPLSITHSDG